MGRERVDRANDRGGSVPRRMSPTSSVGLLPPILRLGSGTGPEHVVSRVGEPIPRNGQTVCRLPSFGVP